MVYLKLLAISLLKKQICGKPINVAKSSILESVEVNQNFSIVVSIVFWLVIYLTFK